MDNNEMYEKLMARLDEMQRHIGLINKKIQNIEKLLDTSVLAKAERFDMMSHQLEELHFHVNEVIETVNSYGEKVIRVAFIPPVCDIVIRDEDKQPQYDPFYVALNMLDLIPQDDVEKVRAKVKGD